MDNGIVREALEPDVRIRPVHPQIERIMQEQIGKQRTNDTPLWGSLRPLLESSVRTFDRGTQPPSPSGPLCSFTCFGLPHPRSKIALDAATRAAGGASLLPAISANVLMASSECSRATASTARRAFGRPPGLPDCPLTNGIQHPCSNVLLTQYRTPQPYVYSHLLTSATRSATALCCVNAQRQLCVVWVSSSFRSLVLSPDDRTFDSDSEWEQQVEAAVAAAPFVHPRLRL
jgi:hypothetical protein